MEYGAPVAGVSTDDQVAGHAKNNYSRPDGQNVGNFLTDRSSSRVLAPPGGGSSIVFGDYEQPAPAPTPDYKAAPAAGSLAADDVYSNQNVNRNANNYARPQGQNVGNFLTDRAAVKVHAPPGGTSQIHFG
jgi:SPIRAL1-like protein